MPASVLQTPAPQSTCLRSRMAAQEIKLLLLTALCAAVAVCAIFAVLGIAPFGENSVVTGDLKGQYIRYYASLRAAILEGESLAYTFTKSLGGSTLGLYAYYYSSPFCLLYVLVPPVHYATLAGLVLGLKLVCACTAMAFFLGRRFPQLGLRGIPCALCYGFCMYAIVYSQNIMWHDTLILLPLVCWGLYHLIHTGKPYVFALWLGLAVFTGFYTAFMVCLFCVLYFGYEMFLVGEIPAAPYGKLSPRGSFWLRRCGSFTLGAVCGAGLSAVLILPAVFELSHTKGLGNLSALTGGLNFRFAEFFHRLLPGSFAWENVIDGPPNVYCGTLCVVLAALYFCAKGIDWREKLLSGTILGVLFLSLYSHDFYLVWHALRPPVWFPYRNSFLFAFFLVFLAAGALARAKWSLRSAVCVVGVGAAFLGVSFFVRHTWFTMTRFCIGALLCAACCVLCAAMLWAKQSRVRTVSGALLLAFCMGEIVLNSTWALSDFELYRDTDYRTFIADGEKTVETLQSHAGNAVRIEKTFFDSLNDTMSLEYNGMSHFSSVGDPQTDRLLSALGYKAYGNSAYGRGSTAFADALLGIRYIMAQDVDTVSAPYRFLDLGTPWQTYENPYVFPMAFMVPESAAALTLPDVSDPAYNTFEAQNMMFEALTGVSQPLFTPADITARETDTGTAVQPTGTYKMPLTYTYTAVQNGLHYAALASKQQALTVFETRNLSDVYFTGLYYGVLNLGEYQQNAKGELRLAPIEADGMDLQGVYVYGMNKTLLAQASAQAQKTAAQLTLHHAFAEGTFRAEQDGILMLSIPYDAGLVAEVDGVPTELVRCLDALIGVRVTAGDHTLRLMYRPPYALLGLTISILSALMLLCAYLWQKRNVVAFYPANAI